MPQGIFCWTELCTRDVPAAKKFYGDLIGWAFAEQDMGGCTYNFIMPPGAQQPVGGVFPMGPQFDGVPPHWMPYIQVDNVDDRAARVTQLGGKVKVPPTDIPNIGRFCIIEDPTGASISLFQGNQG